MEGRCGSGARVCGEWRVGGGEGGNDRFAYSEFRVSLPCHQVH